MKRELDIAWAAGVFEGEGCISTASRQLVRGKTRSYPRITVAMTDRDVVERVQKILDVGSIHSSPRGKNKTMWYLNISNAGDVTYVLRLFFPYLGDRRREKALWALRVCKENFQRTKENTNTAKLNADKAREIRLKLVAGVPPPELAREYDVGRSTIYGIKWGKSYRSEPVAA
jgi:hypothetical protein